MAPKTTTKDKEKSEKVSSSKSSSRRERERDRDSRGTPAAYEHPDASHAKKKYVSLNRL